MSSTVQVKVKSVTGRVRYYPIGDSAKAVLPFTRKKTLSELKIEALKALGCTIERVPGGVFYRCGILEQWGRGTQKIVDWCRAAG